MEEKKEVMEEKKNADFQAGEKGFAVFWMLFGLFFLWQSILLYQKNPGLSSCGAVPLFCSAVIVLCSLIIMITDRKAITPNSGKGLGTQVKQTIRTIFPVDIAVMILLILLYCIALYIKLGFYVATPAFLWIGMTYFMRSKYYDGSFHAAAFGKVAVKNILWTGVCIAFILVMFTYLFSVVLP